MELKLMCYNYSTYQQRSINRTFMELKLGNFIVGILTVMY